MHRRCKGVCVTQRRPGFVRRVTLGREPKGEQQTQQEPNHVRMSPPG